MNTSGTLLVDLHASLLRVATLLATEISTVTGLPCTALYFDAHGDDSTLPSGDLLGFAGLEFEVDSALVDGSFQLGMITENDSNLFRLTLGMNKILSAVLPGESLDIVDAQTGVKKGFLSLIDGTKMLSVMGKAGKPTQLIIVNFLTTLTYQPDQ